ncbi:MAG: hypothetical protein IH621_01245 [Krumholzibacteria bacterium]|nr:hypothetical protein [Candidatus Krumholzibacteria bacterium]
MSTRVLKAAAPVVLLVALLAGCSDDSSERQRVVLEVVTVNNGSPLVAAYQEEDETNVFYTLDMVPVVFYARPYNRSTMTIPADGPYSSFIVTGYNLVWHPGANVPAGLDLSQFDAQNVPFFVQVPVGDEAGSALMVADRVVKEAIGAVLGTPWALDQDFSAYLEIQFIGHASGDDHEVVVPAGLGVNFTFALWRA